MRLSTMLVEHIDKLQPWITEVAQTRDAAVAIACAEFGSMIENLTEIAASATALAGILRGQADPDAWRKLDQSMRAAKPANL